MAPTTPPDYTVENIAHEVAADIKPKLRGWLHASAIPLSLVGGFLLIVFATSTLGRVGGAVYLAASLLLFGTSATYHRFGWGKTGAAILGVLFRIVWLGAPRWLYTVLYIGMGWAAVAWLPQLWSTGGALVIILIGVGGLIYTGGAVVYALK